ncbi:MAG: hypothetical protein AAFZ15_26630 [Bacteroidota bacterium]
MKITKSLLKAMMIGVTLSTASSCSGLFEEVKSEDLLHECDDECEAECKEGNKVFTDTCPACGMG